jgi:hypothetical protein
MGKIRGGDLVIDFLKQIVRQTFCKHKYRTESRDRYEVIRNDRTKEGEVTLTLISCIKCKKYLLMATDRVHFRGGENHGV